MATRFLMQNELAQPERNFPRRAMAAGVYVVGYLLFAWFALRVEPMESLVPVVLCAVAGAVLGVYWVWSFTDWDTGTRTLVRLILVGAAVDIAFNYAAIRHVGGTPFAGAVLQGVANLGLLFAAIGAGLLVGRGLQKPNYLVVAATVGAVTDVFSVYGGPSKHFLASEMLFPYISFHWGLIGAGGVTEVVGAGDFIFLALYFFGARKFGLDERKTLGAMIIAIMCGFVVTYFSTLMGLPGVPALPFFSVALLLAHRSELRTLIAREAAV